MVTTNGKSAQFNAIMRCMFHIASAQNVPGDVLQSVKQIEPAQQLEGVGRGRES